MSIDFSPFIFFFKYSLIGLYAWVAFIFIISLLRVLVLYVETSLNLYECTYRSIKQIKVVILNTLFFYVGYALILIGIIIYLYF